MTVTVDTDDSGNVERIPISSQPTTMSDELANRAGRLREVRPSDAVIGFEYRGKLYLRTYRRSSEGVTRMETVLPSLSGGTCHSVHRGQAGRHSFRRPPFPSFVG
jgi:hypothetical protein